MDIDENDMMFTNQFIGVPQTLERVSDEFNDEFRNYYKEELEQAQEQRLRQSLDTMSLRSIHLDEDNDANSLMNTNKFDLGGSEANASVGTRKVQEVKTYVSIDSRDRNTVLFSKPNFFKIFLGKTFYNVKSIRLANIEFPNTNAVINSSNNRIYWRNLEDIQENIIDSITGTYPVYEVDLRIGSYIATSLQSEITSKMDLIKRQNKTGDFHYFQVRLDIDTDIVTATSLVLMQLGNNPFSLTTGLGVVTVTAVGHGFSEGETVYIVGSKNTAGIPGSVLNGPHEVSLLDEDRFQFEVNIQAGENGIGGGNTVKVGKLAPFQFLFGEKPHTLARNIGYPVENSSQRIDTSIKSIQNLYLVEVELRSSHPFTNTPQFLNTLCTFAGTDVDPSLNGNRVLVHVVDSTKFLVQSSNRIAFPSFNTGTMTYNGVTYQISSLQNYISSTVAVTTFTDHNLDPDDVGKYVTFYDTTSVPNFNQSNQLVSVLSSDTVVIPGNVLSGGETMATVPGQGGTMPRHDCLTTKTLTITDVIVGSAYTTLVSPNHNLKTGDSIQFLNQFIVPSPLDRASGIFDVFDIPSSDTFRIAFASTDVLTEVVNQGQAAVGSNVVSVSFPGHGFNNIVSIQNMYTPKNVVSVTKGTGNQFTAVVTTSAPHGLTVGQVVKLTGTNSTPVVDGDEYEVLSVLSESAIEIQMQQELIVSGNTGQLTLDTMKIRVITQFPHNLENGKKVRIMNTDCVPSLDGGDHVVTVISSDEFEIEYGPGIVSAGTSGIIGMNHDFFLYNVKSVGGIPSERINGVLYTVRSIEDINNFTFACDAYATEATKGGGTTIFISSLQHGFYGTQENTRNSLLHRSISLEGENYAFLCCPQLATMMNTGSVKNVFARITLDQSPGSMVFSFLSNPKTFDTTPLGELNDLEFSVVNYDNTLYEFNDVDYSFVLEITEVRDVVDTFNVSSKRGVSNVAY